MHPLRWLIHLAVNMAAVAIAAGFLAGVEIRGFVALLLVTVALGVINTLIRPILGLVTLPLNVITLGIFGIILNAVLVLIAANLVGGFVVASFWWALAFSLVLGVVSWFLHLLESH